MAKRRVHFVVYGQVPYNCGYLTNRSLTQLFARRHESETPAQAVQRSVANRMGRRPLGLQHLGRRGSYFIYMMAFGRIRGVCRGLVLSGEYVLKVLVETEDGLI